MELTKTPQKTLTLKKHKSIFEDWFNNQLSKNTKQTYFSVLKSFEAFLRSHDIVLESIKQVKPKMIMAYRDFLVNKNLSNKSINLHLATLSSVFQEYYFKQELKENPVSRVKRPPTDTKKIKHHLTDKEIDRLINSFRENQFHLKCAFVVMATTAQRASSILNLKKQDIHYLENKMVLSLKVKRGKQKLLPVPMLAEALLKELIQAKKDDEYLFVGRNQINKPLTLRSFNQTLKVKARKVRIKKEISSHTCRRSLLSKLIMKGHSLDKIKDSVSFHSSVQTLYEYRSNQSYDLKENPILALDYLRGDDRDIWKTPQSLISRLEREFGAFDLDVCANFQNKICDRFFDKATNGLEQDWSGNLIWCNPPYSQKLDWINKADLEAKTGAKIIMLLPAFTETNFFRELRAKSHWLMFLNGRLVFNEHEQKETAKFSSVLAFFNIEKKEIADLGWSV